jgi:hypothetical protein
MIQYALLENDPPLLQPIKNTPKMFKNESECNMILFVFIFGVLIISLGE